MQFSCNISFNCFYEPVVKAAFFLGFVIPVIYVFIRTFRKPLGKSLLFYKLPGVKGNKYSIGQIYYKSLKAVFEYFLRVSGKCVLYNWIFGRGKGRDDKSNIQHERSRIKETLNLSMCADSSCTDTKKIHFFLPVADSEKILSVY